MVVVRVAEGVHLRGSLCIPVSLLSLSLNVRTHIPVLWRCAHVETRSLGSWLYPCTMWGSGPELISSGLVLSPFTSQAILSAPLFSFEVASH